MVTAAYLRRFILFWQNRLDESTSEEFPVNGAVADLLGQVHETLTTFRPHLADGFSDRTRREFMDRLGAAATRYRATVYQQGLASGQVRLSRQALQDFLALAQAYIEQTLRANRRADGLYHSYNTLRLREGESGVESLYLMLEGQVAILSSALLTPEESLALLQSLRQSALYRADQHTYLLYPNRQLPGFLAKNNIPAARVADSGLVSALAGAGDKRLLAQDVAGVWHFNGQFRNAGDVARVLDELAAQPDYAALATAERADILDLFESVFNHSQFTGRSGTFFAFEGLGSVYWHMVSKLMLAAYESYAQAVAQGADSSTVQALAAAYYDIRAGIGFNKTPDVYGAFPTDPYSHTPMGGGASQPGMTGQVKEEILTRWGELGVGLEEGALCFAPTLLQADEFLPQAREFTYFDLSGQAQTLALRPGSLAFTFCQTPVIYQRGKEARIETIDAMGNARGVAGHCLDAETTQRILDRDGSVARIVVTIP